ncbi:hypothetical protein LFL96_33030 [Paraburkholderia sp. D15]|uniref:hypothetical protein n=1 Tax=Paraburkholderia sp. D15 TaxID=2880218 RepID=UPI00247A8ADE|nr:hypothetical protein [Paraburkholderia sp. D15]WGS52996.1 hypothetical protein LFL96_33030 [Paraburkholderia sp. D15]
MTRQITIKLLLIAVLVVIAVIGGWYLTCLFSLLPFNMPDFIDSFIRFALSITGNDDLANPDDMEMLSFLLYWLVFTILTGTLTFFGYRTFRHYRQTVPR